MILFFKSRSIPNHDNDYWDHTPELKDDTQTPVMPEAEKEYDVQVSETNVANYYGDQYQKDSEEEEEEEATKEQTKEETETQPTPAEVEHEEPMDAETTEYKEDDKMTDHDSGDNGGWTITYFK